MITTIDVTDVVNRPTFDHRAFIQWLYANVGSGLAVGSIYEFKRSPELSWCWESCWARGPGLKKHEFIHIRGVEHAKFFNLVWML